MQFVYLGALPELVPKPLPTVLRICDVSLPTFVLVCLEFSLGTGDIFILQLRIKISNIRFKNRGQSGVSCVLPDRPTKSETVPGNRVVWSRYFLGNSSSSICDRRGF